EVVQAEQVSRKVAREHLGLPQDAWVVGNVGRLHPDKDQSTLICGFAQALPQLPTGSLLAIMGSGRLEASLKALAAELGVAEQVYFLGQVANGRRYFKAFDVFTLTSDHEPFGMVLLEAMAAGVPVIASDCGGAREVVVGVGSLFPLGNKECLAHLLIERAEPEVREPDLYADVLNRFSDETARHESAKLLCGFGLRGIYAL